MLYSKKKKKNVIKFKLCLGGKGFDNGLTDSINLRPFRYADSINPCINHYVYIVDFSNKICHNHYWFILIFLASDAPNIQKSKI